MTFTLSIPTWFRRAMHRDVPVELAFDLLAGQRRDIGLAPGHSLRVTAGEVTLLRPPRWLGDTLVASPAIRLGEGDAWAAVEREPVTVVGNRTSRVVRVAC